MSGPRDPLLENVDGAPANSQPSVCVDNASLKELRFAAEDAIREYFTQQRGYKEIHTMTNVRLVLGYAAALASISEFAYTWKKPMEEIRHLTAISVIAYIVFSSALSIWIWFVQGNTIFTGYNDVEHIQVDGKTNGYTPAYTVIVRRKPQSSTSNAKTRKPQQETLVEKTFPFGDWFDTEGNLVRSALEQSMSSLVL